ncbi:MAG: hypothetical protein QXI33_01955 [Candidatus Pacearchaeota archaeon]
MDQDWVSYDLNKIKEIYDSLIECEKLKSCGSGEEFLNVVEQIIGDSEWKNSLSRFITQQTHDYLGKRYNYNEGVGFKGLNGRYFTHNEYCRYRDKILRAIVSKAIIVKSYGYGELLHENGLVGYLARLETDNSRYNPFEK